ncbi:methyltransferase domain-containing protein [Candidatus Rickettsia kedanie]
MLDAGCGVGRDTKYFLGQGYQVTAFNGSSEMVKLATKETGIDVLH